jgi:subtilisin family serine protease
VEPDILFSPEVTGAATNDSLFNKQWQMDNQGTSAQHNGTVDADMDVVEAWSVTKGSAAVTIGLLDSGVDTAHSDLKSNLIKSGYDGTDQSKGGYPSDSFPEDAHGTACAGILAAEANNQKGVAGVAYNCKVVSVRVFYYRDLDIQNLGITPFSTGSWMIDGISWAWQQGGVDVASNAWGVPDTLIPILSNIPGPVDDAIDQAVTNGRNGLGLPMLFSTGNEDIRTPLWPSRTSNTIAVTATSMCDERKSATSCDGESWWGGNYGEGVDIAAPGVKIPTTDRAGQKGYEADHYKLDFNGTSAACPNAAAVVALMLSVNPDLSNEQVEQTLASTADTVGGYAYDTLKEYGSWSKELGYGRVNAFQAVQRANNVVDVPDQLKADQQPAIELTPNPASKEVMISLSNWQSDELTITIYDLAGRKRAEWKTGYQKSLRFPLGEKDLSKGIYFVEVQQGTTRQVEKLLVDQLRYGF